MSPTQLTLRKYRRAGYMAQVVERWIPQARIRRDLFGFVDVVAVGHGETVGIQTTSYGNIAARVRKIEEMPEIVAILRDANWRLVVEGWRKPAHRWVCREVEVS